MNNDYWRYVQEDKYYALYLWILDIKSKEDPKQLLLYGVAIPHNVHDNMQIIDKWDIEKLSTIKIEGFQAPVDTYRIHCHIKGEDLKTFSDY